MNTLQAQPIRAARALFLMLLIPGILMLIASTLVLHFGGQIADVKESHGLLAGAIACLFAASINYSKYLSR